MTSFRLHKAYKVIEAAISLYTEDAELRKCRVNHIVREMHDAGLLPDAERVHNSGAIAVKGSVKYIEAVG